MRPAPFTLVYTPVATAAPTALGAGALAAASADSPLAPPTPAAAPAPAVASLDDFAIPPASAKTLEELPAALSRSLLAAAAQVGRVGDYGSVADVIEPVVNDLARAKDVVTVAVWDIDARVGLLSRIITLLNESQPAFTFFTLQAPIPAGLLLDAAHSKRWAKARGKRPLTKSTQREFAHNLLSDDFFKHAQRVYKDLGVQYLIGITKYMIAGTDRGGELFWNYIAVTKRKSMIVSVHDLREFAREAGRPFEVAVAALVVAQVLDATNRRLSFHQRDTGCLFDFNDSRVSLVKTLRELKIEDRCLAKLDTKYREAAVAMIKALQDYSRLPLSESPSSATLTAAQNDDDYWLKQLKGLSKRVTTEMKK